MLQLLLMGAAMLGGGEKENAGCPHTTVSNVEATAKPFGNQECGSGFRFRYEGVEFGGGGGHSSFCPLFVLVHPGHSAVVPGEGSAAHQSGTAPIVRISFKCVEHWLLGIIPVVVSSSCKKTGEENAGSFATFASVPCEETGAH